MSHALPKRWSLIIMSLVLVLAVTPLLASCDDDGSDVATVTVTKTVQPTATEPITPISAPLPTEYSME